jgi:hypothetical protein
MKNDILFVLYVDIDMFIASPWLRPASMRVADIFA